MTNAHVGLALIAVGVGAQVAQVGLGIADDADGLAVFIDRLGIVDGQLHVGLGHDLVQLLVQGFSGLNHGVLMSFSMPSSAGTETSLVQVYRPVWMEPSAAEMRA